MTPFTPLGWKLLAVVTVPGALLVWATSGSLVLAVVAAAITAAVFTAYAYRSG